MAVTTTRASRVSRIPPPPPLCVALLCAALCVCSCSRKTGGDSASLPEARALYHAALVDSFARHAFFPEGKFDVQQLKTKKYLIVFFGARWSESSQKFTARLVEFHNEVSRNGDNDLGVIFVSMDRNPFDMGKFMRETAMPWPGVHVHSPGSKELRTRYAGPGVPCLVLLDEHDNILARSHDETGKNFPMRVITAYQKIKNPAPKKTKGAQDKTR